MSFHGIWSHQQVQKSLETARFERIGSRAVPRYPGLLLSDHKPQSYAQIDLYGPSSRKPGFCVLKKKRPYIPKFDQHFEMQKYKK